MPAGTLVLLNPRSAGGSGERRLAALAGRLREGLGPYELARTERPRDGVRLAREALRAGFTRLVVAGGDGTLGEAVTGVLEAGLPAEIGVLPLGTGADFPRSVGLGEAEDALAALASGKSVPIDAGRVRYRGPGGLERTAGFLNVASFGASGLVVERVNRARLRLPGRLAYLLGTLAALASYRSSPVSLRLDGEPLFDGEPVLCAVANGAWFGGGMHVAPRARLDDGQLDVVLVRNVARWRLASKLSKIYSGRHLDDPLVLSARGRVLEAECAPGALPLEVDGDPLGALPARFEAVSGLVSLMGSRL